MVLLLLQRRRPLHNKQRPRKFPRKKTATYAYVNLENLDQFIQLFRRQRADADAVVIPMEYNPRIDSDIEEVPHHSPRPSIDRKYPKLPWYETVQDTFDHIKFDPEAPDFTELMPAEHIAEKEQQWGFYHRADNNPFRD